MSCRIEKNKCQKFLLTGVAVAVLTAAPGAAFAKEERTANQNDMPHYTEEEVKQGLKDAKEGVSEAAKDISDAAKDGYAKAKEAVNGDQIAGMTSSDMDQRVLASGMIGEPVYGVNGERLAKVKDIILDANGNATMVILADGEWTGLGKLAAFDYSVITKTNENGDVIAPLTEEMIGNAASFSYDGGSRHDNKVKVVPQNGYSVAALLDSKLLDPEGNVIAEVENIFFRNGEAERLVIAFDQVLGLGGKKASLDFDAPQLVNEDGAPHFKLSAAQTEKFNHYKETAVN